MIGHCYIPLLRLASWVTLPPGVTWEYVELPQAGVNRTDLPVSRHRYGIIRLDRALTAEECEHFDLMPAA